MEPEIIFEDEAVVVINKPAGMVVNDAETVKDLVTVQKWFKPRMKEGTVGSEFEQKGGVVHRLDKDTSGVMILAKTEVAYENLKLQFLERKSAKKYLALVHGRLKANEGILSAPIERNPNKKQKFYVGTDPARTAITEWSVKQVFGEYSLVELRPHTGRTHQLRVHMTHLGHPIVGDPIYGIRRELENDRLICPRMWLHAEELEVTHPTTGQKQIFRASVPEELANTLEKLVH